MKTCLQDFAIDMFLTNLEEAKNYVVSFLTNKSDILDAIELTKYRNNSYKRFECLLKLVIDRAEYNGYFFKVDSRSNGHVDVVFVSDNGCLACTSPYYMNYGMLSKHILSVYLNGYFDLSITQHFHESYWAPVIYDMSNEDKALLIMSVDFKKLDHNCNVKFNNLTTWDWGYKVTKDLWFLEGLGGNVFNYVYEFSANNAKHTVAESQRQMLTNHWYKLIPRLLQNSDYSGKFLFLCQQIEHEEQQKAKMMHSVINEQNTSKNYVVPSFGIAGSKVNKFGKGNKKKQ